MDRTALAEIIMESLSRQAKCENLDLHDAAPDIRRMIWIEESRLDLKLLADDILAALAKEHLAKPSA